MKHPSDLAISDIPLPYSQALAQLRRLHGERRDGLRRDLFWLTQHEPVITLGRGATERDLAASPEAMRHAGVESFRVERGGKATCHLPGQWVGYPLWKLRERGLGVRRLVEGLEEAMIRAAADFGVSAFRRPGAAGVFCERGKLGAVGLAVSAGVTLHGFSFTVDADLRPFALIVPCGLTDVAPTSLALAAGKPIGMTPCAQALLRHLSEVFDTDFGTTTSLNSAGIS